MWSYGGVADRPARDRPFPFSGRDRCRRRPPRGRHPLAGVVAPTAEDGEPVLRSADPGTALSESRPRASRATLRQRGKGRTEWECPRCAGHGDDRHADRRGVARGVEHGMVGALERLGKGPPWGLESRTEGPLFVLYPTFRAPSPRCFRTGGRSTAGAACRGSRRSISTHRSR